MVKNPKETKWFTVNPGDEKARINLSILNAIKRNTPDFINDIANNSGIPDDIVTSYINSYVANNLLKPVNATLEKASDPPAIIILLLPVLI